LLVLASPALLMAVEHSGTVRAADQFVPGATVTASQNQTKVKTFTDESGRYSMDLSPGVWDVQVEMFGFPTVHQTVTVADQPTVSNWTLEMARLGQSAADAAGVSPEITGAANGGRGRGQGRGGFGRGGGPGRGGFGQRQGPPAQAQAPAATQSAAQPAQPAQGFQNATVAATEDGQQALATAANAASSGLSDLTGTSEADEAFLVNGSTSGGLAAASDDEARRQRDAGRGGPGGDGGPGLASLGVPPGMSISDADLGLGGLGANAINAGFGTGPAGGGPGPGGGPGGLAGGRGGGGGGGNGFAGGGGGGGGGGRGGGRGGRGNGRGGRGGGQFANFGNRRPTQPPLTGSVSINLNNSALNAAPFSLNGQPSAKPSSNRANYTATIGGPMVIPKLLNWQRASFNVTYQGTISRSAYNGVGTVPTPDERDGNFSQLLTGATPVTIYDPMTHQPFPNNQIPLTQIDKAALGLLNYFPQPLYSGIVQNYRLVSSVPNNNNNIGVRLNAPLTNRDRLTFNIQFQNRTSASEQLFGFRDTSTGSGLSSALGWSHSFGRRFNNSVNLTLSRNNNKNAPFFAYSDNVAAQLGITGTSQDPINFGPPNLSFTNFGSLSDGAASVTRNQTINFTDNITLVVRRKHNITFGFGYQRLQQNSLTDQNARGSFNFSGLLTSALDANGQPVKGTGYDFADFLLGLPQSSSLRFGSDNNYFRSWATNGFAQDDYRISRSMTLNVGLRYEYFAPYTELQGHLANLDVSPGFTAVSVVTPGQAGPYSGALPSSLIRSDPNNLSPRFGLAWRPSAKDSLVFRTGYSIFYSGSSYAQIASQMASQPPFATTSSISTSLADPLTIENGFAVTPSQITNTYAVDPNYKLAYAQTWNFSVQHNLPHAMLLEVEYIGTKGTHLGILEQPNRALPGSSPLTAQQQLQIGNATGFNYQTYGGNSIFEAGQTRLTRRFTRGMSFVALYTYSKSIDDASSFTGTGGTTVQFINNWDLERGLSSTDQRHRLQLDYQLSSPVGVNGMLRNGGWKTLTLAGWTMNGTFTAASGTPLTATVAGNLSNTGGIGAFGSSRAQATGLPIDGGGNPYFNLLAFTTPPAGQFGNAGRDTIPGPFQTSLNASLNRAFRFGDSRRQLQLRLSATNALNHIVITRFGTTVGSSTYGLATTASATRTVALMLRFNY
jgi:hypothetical protein